MQEFIIANTPFECFRANCSVIFRGLALISRSASPDCRIRAQEVGGKPSAESASPHRRLENLRALLLR